MLDIGTGTGLLSMMAVRHKADVVTACEVCYSVCISVCLSVSLSLSLYFGLCVCVCVCVFVCMYICSTGHAESSSENVVTHVCKNHIYGIFSQ